MRGKWGALVVLGAAQFLMVLDQSVMNVSISQLVADFDTTVTTIQAVITLYSLVMAMLMITGGKLGDLLGRKRVFAIGLVVYGAGSFLTAISWSVPTLALGWSVLEGIGAAMVMPALVALVAGSYSGASRVTAYGVLGGVAGAGIAVGPILGGWLTTNATWRLVFAGEVVIVIAILLALKLLREPAAGKRPAGLDWVGSVLSALGLGLIVFGVLQASNWGWLEPRNSPVEPFGFSLVPFVVAAGGLLLWAFRAWERRREERGREPLVRFAMFANAAPAQRADDVPVPEPDPARDLLRDPALPPGRPGIRRLRDRRQDASRLDHDAAHRDERPTAARWAPRSIVRVGLGLLLVADIFLLSTIDPQIDTTDFAIAMGYSGSASGCSPPSSETSSSPRSRDSERSEAGGLQFTAQQLGAALGTALAGAVLISGLIAGFTTKVDANPAISQEISQEVGIRVQSNVTFLSADEVEAAAVEAGLGDEEVDALVTDYETTQLQALKLALLMVGLVVIAAFAGTRRLPDRPLAEGT